MIMSHRFYLYHELILIWRLVSRQVLEFLLNPQRVTECRRYCTKEERRIKQHQPSAAADQSFTEETSASRIVCT